MKMHTNNSRNILQDNKKNMEVSFSYLLFGWDFLEMKERKKNKEDGIFVFSVVSAHG